MRAGRRKLFVESTPLLDTRLSGIGHTLISILSTAQAGLPDMDIVLLSPIDKMRLLKSRTSRLNVKYKAIPLPARGLYGLWKYNLIPPLDILLGSGVYLFPNFRNWRLSKSKSLTYIHDIVHEIHPEFVSPPNQRFLKRNLPDWLEQTSRVITVSEHTKQDIIKTYGYPAEQIDVIHNGVNLSHFYPRSTVEITAVKRRYGLAKDYFVFFSTIEPRKNVNGLLDAYCRLPQKIRSAHSLLLIGSKGWLVDDTTTRIESLRKQGFDIVWPKQYVGDNDIPALLSGASALIHPAFYEGFGISPLQAMACGTPVIAADNSAIPEVVGDCGLYFQADDPDDIAAKISTLLSDPALRKKLSRSGLARAKKFTWQSSVRKLGVIIKELDSDQEKAN